MSQIDDRTSDETLLLFHYAELDAAQMQSLREQMADDAELAARYAELAALLDGVPEPDARRDDFYGKRVWQAIEPKLRDTSTTLRSRRQVSWWQLAGMAAAFGLVAITAYQFGRTTAPPEPMPMVDSSPLPAMESNNTARVMKASFRQHMDNTSRLFLGIENADGEGVIDVEAEKNWATTLLVANRLYRFAAEQAGQKRVAQVLTDMEPMLIELANSERTLTDEEFRQLRQRLANSNLVFKATTTSRSLEDSPAGDSI